MKATDLELNVLMSYEEVTPRVVAATERANGAQAALDARRAEIAAIEKESLDRTGLRSDVVTLYQGAQYWLYRYKKYTDVRLVFAPEQQMAFSAAIPTTSRIRATTWTLRSSASTTTARRSVPSTFSNGTRRAPPKTSWCSSPVIPARPIATTRSPSSKPCATSSTRSTSRS